MARCYPWPNLSLTWLLLFQNGKEPFKFPPSANPMVHLQLWRPCLVQAENNTKFLPFCPILPAWGLCGGGGGSDHKAGWQDLHVFSLPSANILSASMGFLLEALVSQSVKQRWKLEASQEYSTHFRWSLSPLNSHLPASSPQPSIFFFLCDFR